MILKILHNLNSIFNQRGLKFHEFTYERGKGKHENLNHGIDCVPSLYEWVFEALCENAQIIIIAENLLF